MEAEIIYLAHFCQDLFPIIYITQYLGKVVGLPFGVTSIKVSVHEDNYVALILARTFPPNFTPPSKYYATKKILFREEINKKKIPLFKIATVERMGDLFTKVLPRETLEYLLNKVMGW